MTQFSRFVLCVVFVLLYSLHSLGQEANLRDIPIPWYEEPEQHAPHWRVHFDSPTLAYCQRLVVGVRATVSDAPERRTNWHIYLAIADENGRWSRNYGYSLPDERGVPPKAAPLHWHGYAFVRPGAYRIALVAYDAIKERHFVWRKKVQVDRPSILPDIDRDFPAVEFIDPDRFPPPIPEFIPIPTHAPVRIDVVFNLTGNEQLSLAPDTFESLRRPYAEDALRGATVLLSQLAPSEGCVRVSAIDILRLKVVLDRSSADPASNLDQIQQAISTLRDSASIDAHTLAGRTKAREFFHQFLEKVISNSEACSEAVPNVGRVIIVVSDSLMFPKGVDREPVLPPEDRNVLFFYVRLSYTLFYRKNGFPAAITAFDEVGHMLGPLHPHNFDVVEPKDLRRAVAEIVQDIEASAKVSAVRR